jgi:uncharacterized protein (DUF2062 family)
MLKRLWLWIERYFVFNLIRLFRIRAASERVARGFALGLIVNFFPTFGFGVLISGFVAKFFGGNPIAGVIGGATLTFFWPMLFYLNLKTGSLLVQKPIPIDEFDDVTERTIDALVWGKTFTVGAIVNSVIAGLTVYILLRSIYHEVRPGALTYFRRHARDHQRRFRKPVRKTA